MFSIKPQQAAKLKRLRLLAQARSTEALSGEYRSSFKGQGLEFEEVREYVPGDDVRNIDWNVSARTGRTFIKLFRDERERTLLFMVDGSASMGFGSGSQAKKDAALELVALMSYVAQLNQDRIGLLIFSDQTELFLAPKKGQAQAIKIVRALMEFEAKSPASLLNPPAKEVMKVLKSQSMICLISDFLLPGIESPLTMLAKKFELCAIKVRDPMEEIFRESGGILRLRDLEQGGQVYVKAPPKGVLLEQSRWGGEALRSLCSHLRVDLMECNPADDLVDALTHFFIHREKRKAWKAK